MELVQLDRDDEGVLAAANGADLLVDVIPFEAAHAEQLLALDIGAIVAISSASVYADEQGRTLDEAEGVDDFPEFPVPIPSPSRPLSRATRRTRRRRRSSSGSCSRTGASPLPSFAPARSTGAATGWHASGSSSSAHSTGGPTSS
jgi:hypothetical protein